MSLFLGPVHYGQYHKLQMQEQLVERLLAGFPTEGEDLRITLNREYGTLPEGDLRDIIDEGNIHGWLQEQVNRVEKRLAHTAAVLTSDEDRKKILLDTAFAAGAADRLEVSTPEAAFEALQTVLLDGMPCDFVNAARPGTDNGVCWERVNDVHSIYYTCIGADPILFDEIRDAWVNGMLEETGLTYRRDGMKFSVENRV